MTLEEVIWRLRRPVRFNRLDRGQAGFVLSMAGRLKRGQDTSDKQDWYARDLLRGSEPDPIDEADTREIRK